MPLQIAIAQDLNFPQIFSISQTHYNFRSCTIERRNGGNTGREEETEEGSKKGEGKGKGRGRKCILIFSIVIFRIVEFPGKY